MGITAKHPVGRNELCKCGSGLKFKFCHGDPFKVAVCNRVANEKMCELIFQELQNRGKIKLPYHCNGCGKDFEAPHHSEIGQCDVCPLCNNTNIEKDVSEKKDV